MRVPALCSLLALSCALEQAPNPPPRDAFYFPTGLAFARAAGSVEGTLYVANSNFDRRFDRGSLVAVDLDHLGQGASLPALGAPVEGEGPKRIESLNIAEQNEVYLASFAGELGSHPVDGGVRLVVPSRSEGDRIQFVDALGSALSCVGAKPGQGRDCGASSPSAVAFEKRFADGSSNLSGLPRAPAPYGVVVSPSGEAFVTHLQFADSPAGTLKDPHNYLLSVDMMNPVLSVESFVPLPGGASSSAAVGARYVYVSGRIQSQGTSLVRLLDRSDRSTVHYPELEVSYRAVDGRGIALSADERRLFVAARQPDSLLVAEVQGAQSSSPTVRVVRAVALPGGPTQIKVIPRANPASLLAITCALAGTVVLYDDRVGDLVANVASVGEQPLGLAVDSRGASARLYVSNFTDGRIAVVDVPDVERPQEARLVATLGAAQTCLVQPKACEKGTP